MSIDFKTKRIEYLNNWPNVEPFEIEQKYYDLVEKKKKRKWHNFFSVSII